MLDGGTPTLSTNHESEQGMKAAVIGVVSLVLLAGCATTASVPNGMKAGQFVDFSCEGGQRCQARAAADGSSVRVRYEGGYELDRQADGVYEAPGWRLVTQGADALELVHNGKSVGKRCKPA
jgi:hypothetical protein